MIRHLYFHIPFCPRLCPYCSFYVETTMRNKNRPFLNALLEEVKRRSNLHVIEPETLYFGGGTPSMLSMGELDYLLNGLRKELALHRLAEWTFEVNPSTISAAKASLLRSLGVNRISMGVQSWDDELLGTLGRTHTAAEAEETFHILRDAGFGNISLDLMFGIPGQTPRQWRETLERTVSLSPEHISAYCLTYEEDTRFFEQLRSGEHTQDIERDAAMFEQAMDTLVAAGYGQYEISNYARPGFECRHNSGYWGGADYLGFGPSAFSTVGVQRWQNVPDSTAYVAQLEAGALPVSFEETIRQQTRTGETLAFGLRTGRGILAADAEPWRAELDEMRSLGLLESAEGRLRLTRRGKLLADSVAEAFV